MNSIFKGNKVKLRAVKKDEVPRILELIDDEEIMCNLRPGLMHPYLLHDEQKWFDGQTAMSDTYNFAIEPLDEDGKYIGGIGINKIDWKNSVATVGIFIGDKDYLGKGYGTDAMRVLVNYIFTEMNINKVNLGVYSFNKRAQKSYEKVGFKQEGVLRKELFRKGEYHDIISMGIFYDELIKE